VLALDAWRIRRLDEATRLLPADGRATLLLARDGRIVSLPVSVPPGMDAGAVSLATDAQAASEAQALRRAWLKAG
jgi:hypothetical protein